MKCAFYSNQILRNTIHLALLHKVQIVFNCCGGIFSYAYVLYVGTSV